jgi:hypothetical protein
MFLPAAVLALAVAQPSNPFEFKDGDRIVWLGNTLVEREQRYGYWETALLAANADKRITVRNLGWSGDTVHGESRGRFEFANPEKCFRQLVDQTLELKPTVIFVGYGTNESFEGKEGLPKFEKGLNKLLDALKPAGARIVLFSPVGFEAGPHFPEAANRNERLREYRAVIAKVAKERGFYYAPLGERIDEAYAAARDGKVPKLSRLTDNGMHLTELAYLATESAFEASLGLAGTSADPDKFREIELLRDAVIAKNELFFHRWRPQNETYLFGFRKHEQGKNAKEIAEFDPLVAKAEEEIEKIRKTLKE